MLVSDRPRASAGLSARGLIALSLMPPLAIAFALTTYRWGAPTWQLLVQIALTAVSILSAIQFWRWRSRTTASMVPRKALDNWIASIYAALLAVTVDADLQEMRYCFMVSTMVVFVLLSVLFVWTGDEPSQAGTSNVE